MSLFRDGEFTSTAGLQLPWKIDCDALTDDDWQCLARIVAGKLAFDRVVGVPTGGTKFAEHLSAHSKRGQQTLIVDDVLTTGKSMNLVRVGIVGPVTGVVVFSRGVCPSWVYPLFTFNSGLWSA